MLERSVNTLATWVNKLVKLESMRAKSESMLGMLASRLARLGCMLAMLENTQVKSENKPETLENTLAMLDCMLVRLGCTLETLVSKPDYWGCKMVRPIHHLHFRNCHLQSLIRSYR